MVIKNILGSLGFIGQIKIVAVEVVVVQCNVFSYIGFNMKFLTLCHTIIRKYGWTPGGYLVQPLLKT